MGPVVVIMGLLFRGGKGRGNALSYLPWFVIGFLGLAGARSFGVMPDFIANPARDASRLLTIVAMGGLGYGVELAAVRQVGLVVGAAVIGSLAFLATFTVVLIHLLGIGG